MKVMSLGIAILLGAVPPPVADRGHRVLRGSRQHAAALQQADFGVASSDPFA